MARNDLWAESLGEVPFRGSTVKYEVMGHQLHMIVYLMGARFFTKAHYIATITDSGSVPGVGG